MGFFKSLGVSVAEYVEKARRASYEGPSTKIPPGVRATAAVEAMWMQQAIRYKDKPFGLTYDVLRTMSIRDSVIAAIITTRIRQISSFWKPSSVSPTGRGFVIRHRDKKHVLTAVERRQVEKLERFFEACGEENDSKRDRFHTVLKKVVRDRLSYDQVCLELVRNRREQVSEFHPVDASTMRIRYDEEGKQRDGYVQILDGRPFVEIPEEDFVFAVDNPRTDLRIGGYGLSEIEQLISIITGHLFAEEANKRRIQPGVQIEGVLWSDGAELTYEMLESLRRSWQAQAQGVIGAGHIAALSMPQGSKLNYIPVSKSMSDMEWGRWIDYMINVACAVYAIDPAEVNFPNRGSASTSERAPLFEANQESRLINSKDKGLVPLLNFLEETFTEGILWRVDNGDDFLFEFSGIDARSREQESDLARKEVTTFKTLNEYRGEHDLPPIPGGDVILDSAYLQALQLEQQAATSAPGAEGDTQGEEGESGASEGLPGGQGGDSEEGEEEGGGAFDEALSEIRAGETVYSMAKARNRKLRSVNIRTKYDVKRRVISRAEATTLGYLSEEESRSWASPIVEVWEVATVTSVNGKKSRTPVKVTRDKKEADKIAASLRETAGESREEVYVVAS